MNNVVTTLLHCYDIETMYSVSTEIYFVETKRKNFKSSDTESYSYEESKKHIICKSVNSTSLQCNDVQMMFSVTKEIYLVET